MPVHDPGPAVTMADMESQPVLLGTEDSIFYRPTPTQMQMHTSTARYLGYMGGRAAGKTYGALHEAILVCHEVPGCSVLIVMQTFPRLEITYLTELKRLDPAVYGGDPQAYNQQNHTLRFPNGSRIDFRTCDKAIKVDQFQGSQYILIIFDEANSMPWGFQLFDNLTGCLRSPLKHDVSGLYVQPRIIVGSNPGKNQTWLKALFIEKKPLDWMKLSEYDPADYEFVFAHIAQNPFMADAAYIKGLASKGPVLRAQWLDGSFDTIAGVFFDNFDESRSVISADECIQILESQKWAPRIGCMDWGRVHLCPWLFAATVKLYNLDGSQSDHVLVYREKGLRGLEDTSIAEEAIAAAQGHKIERIYASPEIFGDMHDPKTRAKTISDKLVAGGLPRLSRADNSRVDGASLLYDLLGGEGPRSRLLISDDCKDLIESIPQLMSSEKNAEDVQKTTLDSDDWYDCLRMLCKSHLAPREKPDSVVVQEMVAPLAARNDFTAVHMAHLIHQEQQKNQQKPLFIRRRRR